MKHRFHWGRTTLSAAVSLALASIYTANAQDAATEEEEADEFKNVVEEVYVSGLRRSLLNSMDLKENSSSIVEAVSAEEIGKLPDVSIAESLARLPGLAAQRLNGRGQVISVRGLSPDFTTALLNGRPQVSSGDNRGVEFDQYPSELLSAVVVYKTPDASLIGQGLAGTADLRTIRPLKYGKQAIAGNMRYEKNETGALNAGSTDDGIRYSFSYVDQFADDTIGVAVGFAHMTNPSQEKRFNAWGYRNLSQALLPLDPSDPDGVDRYTPAFYGLSDDDLIINGAKPYVRSSELERDGLMAVVEWQPNDKLLTALDIYASDFSETQLLRGIEFPLADNYTVIPETAVNGIVTSGTFLDVKGIARNDVTFRDAELRAIGWNAEYLVNDKWTARADLSYSEAARKDQILETYAGTGPQCTALLTLVVPECNNVPTDRLHFQLTGSQGVVFESLDIMDYTDPNIIFLTSPQGWGTAADVSFGESPANTQLPFGQAGYTNNPRTLDELNNFTFSAERYMENSFFKSIEFGLNFSTRIKSLVQDEFFLALVNGAPQAPIQGANGTSNLSFLGINGVISYDPLTAFNGGGYNLVRNGNADVVAKSWSVEENVTIGYAQFNLATELRNMPLTGNFGLQMVNTDQSSNAFSSQQNPAGFLGGVFTTPTSAGKDYTDWLPSLNLSLEVAEGNFVRFAAARTLARPRMDELRASSVVNFEEGRPCSDANDLILSMACDPDDIEQSPWSTNSGNPLLDPWLANSYDLSYERYFRDKAGYLSAAIFYKELDSYIFNQELEADFTGFASGINVPLTYRGTSTQPANGTGGEVKGLELALTLNFDAFVPALDGFGVFLSASFNDSTVVYNPDDPSLPLPGLSEEIRNITLFYEKAGFSARVSERYRSEFLGEVGGFGGTRDFTKIEEESVIDAQIGYSFGGDSPLSGVSVFLQGNNLTNEPLRTFLNNDPIQVRDYQDYGRTYLLGASYTY